MTLLGPFDRQRRIPGWRQEQLGRARIAVLGRDWLGTFVVWALRSMGIGEITWIGRPRPATEGAARFLLERPCAHDGGAILDEPFDVEYGPELPWALAGRSPDVFVSTTEDADELALGMSWADRSGIPALAGRASGGGWFGTEPPRVVARLPQDPVTALAVAALLVDAVRERLSPLAGRLVPPEGCLGWDSSGRLSEQTSNLLVGVGGVGVWAAIALAAAFGERLHLHLCDFDTVATENLNRQALFTEDDAIAHAPKADAAARSLARIFPSARLSSQVSRVGRDCAAHVEQLSPRPTAILSAVDNAETRLVLQDLGREAGLPVIQGGTATFAADCFTQAVGGRLLDEQMHGALSTAAGRERHENRLPGGCAVDASYIVPGMLAGAFMAYRVGQLGQEGCSPPIRWRLGDLPVEAGKSMRGFDFREFGRGFDQGVDTAVRGRRADLSGLLSSRRA
jgi:molybdopterin/thiamine biosynthesis adenylyltransferase